MSVYIVQTSESIKLKENVYKVGRTKQKGTKRMNGYPKGSELMLQEKVDDDIKMEKAILSVFSNKYKLREDYGKEYFEGDYSDMRQTFRTIVDEVNNGTFVEPVKETREINEEDAAFIMKHIPRYIRKISATAPLEGHVELRNYVYYDFLDHNKSPLKHYDYFAECYQQKKEIIHTFYEDDNILPNYNQITTSIKAYMNTCNLICEHRDAFFGKSHVLKLTPDMEKALNYFN
jgi:hypothetical protein